MRTRIPIWGRWFSIILKLIILIHAHTHKCFSYKYSQDTLTRLSTRICDYYWKRCVCVCVYIQTHTRTPNIQSHSTHTYTLTIIRGRIFLKLYSSERYKKHIQTPKHTLSHSQVPNTHSHSKFVMLTLTITFEVE